MNKRITSLLLSVVLVLLTVFLLQDNRVVEAADNLVLLEKRHPGYWEYLGPEAVEEITTIPEFETISTDSVIKGNILRNYDQWDNDGVTIINHGDSISFTGSTDHDIWPGIADVSNMQTGTYFISIGSQTTIRGVTIFVEGLQNGNWHRVYTMNPNQFFFIDRSQYEDLKFTAEIRAGNSVDFAIKPVAYKISDENVMDKCQTIAVWRDVPVSRLSSEDEKLFQKALGQYKNYQSCVVYSLQSDDIVVFGDQRFLGTSIDDFRRIYRE